MGKLEAGCLTSRVVSKCLNLAQIINGWERPLKTTPIYSCSKNMRDGHIDIPFRILIHCGVMLTKTFLPNVGLSRSTVSYIILLASRC